MKSCKNIVKPALCIQCLTKFSIHCKECAFGCDYYVTIECAQTICAPLLQNAQYATEVRRFSAHTRNRCVMKITKYPDVLALQYWPLFYTYFAIDFSERATPANIDRSILLTARMGRYGFKVAISDVWYGQYLLDGKQKNIGQAIWSTYAKVVTQMSWYGKYPCSVIYWTMDHG